MGPKISVIIPVYKVEPYLHQCLDSVVNQTYRNLEIIIVDDGSPDNCGTICDEYAKADPRIVVIHKENEGLCAARNDGIDKATGEWIAFVDSDDWCELDYYEQLIRGMDNYSPDVLCAGGRIEEYSFGPKIAVTFREPFYYTEKNETKGLMAGVLVHYQALEEVNQLLLGAPWDKLYKTSFINQTALRFDVTSKAWEDFWFNFQAFDKAVTVKGCTCIGYHYRQVITSIVNGFNCKKPQINYNFVYKLYHYAEQEALSKEIIPAVEARTIPIIINSLDCYYFHPSNQETYRNLAREMREMKMWPYFRRAIWSNNNQYLTKKQIVLKHLLRLPWIWPLKTIYSINKKVKK